MSNDTIKTVYFNSFEELAHMTLPYLLKGNIALSGGATYGRLFPEWVMLSPGCGKAIFFPVDERAVGFDDPQSNWGAAYRDFLVPVGNSRDKSNFATGAASYRAVLKARFSTDVPVFDAIFLGVGGDGHTASLFPDQPYLDDLKSIVLETTSPKPPLKRVTLAMAPLIAAKTAIVIVAGGGKKRIVPGILKGDDRLPIVKVLARRKSSLLFIDRELTSG